MLGETKNQFSRTRAASRACGRAKTKFLSVLAAMAMLATLNASAQLRLGITQLGNDSVLFWPTTVSNCVLQSATNVAAANWLAVSNVGWVVNGNNYTVTVPNTVRARFFRLYNTNTTAIIAGMALIPAGTFTMGNCMDPNEGNSDELPLHTVYVSAFYMDQYDVTYALWQRVYNWAVAHGYQFDDAGSGKAANYPVQAIDWFDCVKWCNARSEMEGRIPAYYNDEAQTVVYRTGWGNTDATNANSLVNWNAGYRLPTEAEWEKAARGDAIGQRFPWGNTISWSQANYLACPLAYAYDVNPTDGYDPAFNDGVQPYTSPVNYFAPNGYVLFDMAGNVSQWCWDAYGSYGGDSQSDPRGPPTGSHRVLRGGSWIDLAGICRTAHRDSAWVTSLGYDGYDFGFRSVIYPGP